MRIERRLADLESAASARETIYIVGGNAAECDRKYQQMEAAGEIGGRDVLKIITGVPRADGTAAAMFLDAWNAAVA